MERRCSNEDTKKDYEEADEETEVEERSDEDNGCIVLALIVMLSLLYWCL